VTADANGITNQFLLGMAWGAGFAVPFFVGITWSILKVLSHPSVRALSRAADKLSGAHGGALELIVKEGIAFLKGKG